MKKTISKAELSRISMFALVLLCMLALSYAVQVFAFSFPSDENLLGPAYLFNGLFALVSFASLIILNRVNPRITGFVFMIGSALKFLLFFLVFYPAYHADGEISRMEFASFFVPYAIGLSVELLLYIRD